MVEYNFMASDGVKIFYDVYEVEHPKAIIQIVHGSIEHGQRYKEFAEFLVRNDYEVVVPDLRGHGRSIGKKLNYLSDKDDGWELYIEETKTITEFIKEKHPDKKIFIMGHSMGSFIVRDYISRYGDLIDGAILSGTGSTSPIVTKILGRIIKGEIKKFGKDANSQKLHKLIYGGLDKKAKKLNYDSMISRDSEVTKKYIEDPLCGGVITADYANEMAKGILYIESKECYKNTANIPLYIFSGEKDPVGGKNCNSVKNIYKKYNKFGLDDVTLKIYPGGLHEMLNETNKVDVYKDVLEWVGKKH